MFPMYLLIGAMAGTLAGLFGVGGSVIVVPALATLFFHYHVMQTENVMHMAIGTSLAAMIFTLLSALYAHSKRGSVRWDMVRTCLPQLLIGAIVGAVVAKYLSANFLRVFFGVFLLYVSYRLVFVKIKTNKIAAPPSQLFMRTSSGIIGILSSILGLGGGSLLIPFLLRCQINLREATGTSVACALGVAIIATASFMVLGLSVVKVSDSTGYIYWPAFFGVALTSVSFAPVGALLAHRLSASILKPLFALFLTLIAILMLLG